MQKLRAIREHLAETVPSLKKNPDKLHVYIEKGGLACRYGGQSFEYRFEAKIMVEDFADEVDTLIIPLLVWLKQNQPDLLLNPDKSDNVIRYVAELIDHEKADVELSIDGLTERVVVTEDAGIYTATHVAEPNPADLEGDASEEAGWGAPFAGVEIVP
jgi:hypothetical protein